MKKCPTCQKEFPDAMRFCQTDGTPLADVVAQPPEDLLKTTVVRAEELADVIPPSDPFKTTVGAPIAPEESGDLLQIPEEIDPMKTMIATPINSVPVAPPPQAPPVAEPESPKFEEIRQEIKPQAPSNPFDAFSAPAEPLPEPPAAADEPTVLQPEPPKFSEPELSPPSFSAEPAPVEDMAATMIQGSWEKPVDPEPAPAENPFTPAPPPSPFEAPASPFGQPSFEAPPAFQEPPPVQFGQQQFDAANQAPEFQAMQGQAEWTPPAPPEQGWQNQSLGANTPFQPPVAGGEGANKTLPIVSLVFGIVSLCCYVSPLTGLVALVTGFLGMKNAKNDPAQYGGRGLAIAGMVTGGVFFLVGVLYWIYVFFIIGMALSQAPR